jgi:5-methylcytosine-specific restriction endonuclease McrA
VLEVLDDWDARRERVSGHVEELLRRQRGRCAHCGVIIHPSPKPVDPADPLKPYGESPEELLAPEVDHIEPISGFGTNELKNLQVLCALCNRGKGDGLGVSLRDEARYAAVPVREVPLSHRIRMLYYVLARDRATIPHPLSAEYSVQFVRGDGGYLRSNLPTRIL